MYDFLPSSWQLINSFLVKCGWFGLEELFHILDWLTLQNWRFIHSKLFARNIKDDSLLGQGAGSKVGVVKLTIHVQESFLESILLCVVTRCRLKEWCFCDWRVQNAFNSFSFTLQLWTYAFAIIIKLMMNFTSTIPLYTQQNLFSKDVLL